MGRFRTRPREAEAFQWLGELEDIPSEFHRYVQPSGAVLVTCYTKGGPVQAAVGDWLILGDGEVYPCKQDEFEKRYEPAVSSVHLCPPADTGAVAGSSGQ